MTCNCNRTGDVEYQITLDAQGPQGRQGNAGPAGFSPVVDVYSNTDANYQLKIITSDGEIITPNLKGQTPELPDGLANVNNSNVFREVNYFENGLKANYVTIKTPDYDYKIDTALNDITVTKVNIDTGEVETKLIAYKKDLEPYVLDTDLDTKLENYVTLDTTQAITGSKNFDKGIIIAEHSLINALGLKLGTPDGTYCSIGKNEALLPTNTYLGTTEVSNNLVLTPNLIRAGEGISLTFFDGYLTISATGGSGGEYITSATAPLNVTEGNLTLAIDNQTIQVNTEGKLVANLDEIGNELNSVSNRVTSLETEVTNLSGEVATNTADISTIRGSLGNNLISKLTATEYSNLASKDSNTLYIVIADDNSNFTMYYGEIPMYMPSGGSGDNASQRTYITNVSTTVTAEPYTA